ncbi:MAG: Ig-like domain-containing protein [Pseudomonadota bacterium]
MKNYRIGLSFLMAAATFLFSLSASRQVSADVSREFHSFGETYVEWCSSNTLEDPWFEIFSGTGKNTIVVQMTRLVIQLRDYPYDDSRDHEIVVTVGGETVFRDDLKFEYITDDYGEYRLHDYKVFLMEPGKKISVKMKGLCYTGSSSLQFYDSKDLPKTLYVDSVSPAPDAQSVSTNTVVLIKFDQTISTFYLSKDYFSIYNMTKGGILVDGKYQIYDDTARSTVKITPSSNLEPNTVYQVVVKAEVRNYGGYPMNYDYVWVFTTGDDTDQVPPTVTSTTPADGEKDVPINQHFFVEYSKSLDPTTINEQNAKVMNATTEALQQIDIALGGKIGLADSVLEITPETKLDPSTTYQVIVSDEVTDVSGNNAPLVSLNYETGATEIKDPLEVDSSDPADGATNVAPNAAVSVKFSRKLNSTTVQESNIYVVDAAAQTRVGGELTYSSTDQTVTFQPNSAFEDQKTYQVVLTTDIRDAYGKTLSQETKISFGVQAVKTNSGSSSSGSGFSGGCFLSPGP